jgi:carbon dioxide concentrating mechanism protein CcmN
VISSPPLHRLDEQHFYISGDVIIHPSVAIAAGVLLQADPDSQLILAEGVCVGAGTILHACGGTLELEPDVSLGSGVLIVGSAKIGARACIGSMSTLLDWSVEEEQVVPPNSLLGDDSRQMENPSVEDSPIAEAPASMPDVPPPNAQPSDVQRQLGSSKASVYGLESFNELMTMLFPHRQTLNGLSVDASSSGKGDGLQ